MKTFSTALILSTAACFGLFSGQAMANSSDDTVRSVRDIAPAYPDGALRRGTEGYVLVRFDVNSKGKAHNIEVVDAEPAHVFTSAVHTALRRSDFEVPEGVSPSDHERVYRFEAGTVSSEDRIRIFNAFHQ